ncbi:maltokinase N-terminal cap-like domain-containing protein [Brevibacterium litoralis]|uniref:maltokinase N-terminal cap-like domain-containing protein n=1 Tax=Brevibacterium litoralis TaxID=3138935 RepID=UPI0032EB348C
MAISSDLERLLAAWLPRRSWYPQAANLSDSVDITPLSVTRLFGFGPADTEIGSTDGAGPGTTGFGSTPGAGEDPGTETADGLTVEGLMAVVEVASDRVVSRLNVPLTFRTREDYALRPHLIGVVEDITLGTCWVYDGMADPVFVVTLAQALATGRAFDGDQVVAHGVGETSRTWAAVGTGQRLVSRAAEARLGFLDGADEVTSVLVSDPQEPCVLTLFRVLEPGTAGDPAAARTPGAGGAPRPAGVATTGTGVVTVPVALTEADSAAVSPVLGWAEGRWFDARTLRTETAPLGLLSSCDTDTTPAWREAVDTVLDVDSGSLGGYNKRAMALGGRVGELHLELAGEFGTVVSAGDPARGWVSKWSERVDWAFARAPLALQNLAGPLRRHRKLLQQMPDVGVLQRIHGELTLNHVVTSEASGFRITDFADTPADDPKPAAIDLVALLRSIDYAAGYARLRRIGALDSSADPTTVGSTGLDRTSLHEVTESPEHLWSGQAQNALLTGYSHAVGASVGLENPVLRAALVDRLLVETVTELRNRPTWLVVPLAALSGLLGVDADAPAPRESNPVEALVHTGDVEPMDWAKDLGKPVEGAEAPSFDFASPAARRKQAGIAQERAARAAEAPAEQDEADREPAATPPDPAAAEGTDGAGVQGASAAVPDEVHLVEDNDPEFEEYPPVRSSATGDPDADDDTIDSGEIDIYPPRPTSPPA